ncbi:MAG: AAA family ATPase [Deltaproteobacteria bacterium]|nr:AAA family ATPase [Deltaproteobacteria bacterium]
MTLQIRDFALIENATIEFGEGLNVLSGETGAGKSILVQAIELLLGGRGSVDLIREGKDEAEVSGLFDHPSDGGEVSVRRIISRSGKSRAFLNERPVPVATLGEVTRDTVDLANQHEHQILLQPEQHLSLLDAYALLEVSVSSYREGLKEYKDLLVEREELSRREQATREKEEFLRFQLKELNEANVQEGEEESLKREREVLKHAVRLGETCLKGEEALESGEGSITEHLSHLLKDLGPLSEIDPQLAPLVQQMEGSLCQLQEAATSLRQYGEKVSYDPERLQEVEDRSALLSRLKKKYGGSLETLMQKKEEISQALTLLDHFEEGIQARDQVLEQKGKLVLTQAKKISEARKSAALKLSKEIEKELKGLGMGTARFSLSLQVLGIGWVFEDDYL